MTTQSFKISELPQGSALSGEELLEATQNGRSVQIKAQLLLESGGTAYQSAVKLGFQGTEAQWLASLRGGQGLPGPQGTEGPLGPTGLQGLRGIRGETGLQGPTGAEGPLGPQGAIGLQGPQGIQGIQGDIGLTGLQGETGPQGPRGNDGVDGQPGVQGERGLAGVIGYDGPQGPQGLPGAKGDQGDVGAGFLFKGGLENFAQLGTPQSQPEGTTYLIDGHFVTRIGAAWVDAGSVEGPMGLSAYRVAQSRGFTGTTDEWLASLKGNDGIGLRILGSFVSVAALPVDALPGDAYIVEGKMQVWDGLQYSEVGQQGPAGASAFSMAVKLGFNGTLSEWLTSLKGRDNYQIAKSLGFVGTQAEWLESIKGAQGDQGEIGLTGPQGAKGDMGAGVKILGRVAAPANLPASGTLGEGYLIDVNFWGWTGSSYENLGPVQGPKGDRGLVGPQGVQGERGYQGIPGPVGLTGKAAYEYAVERGFEGSATDWVVSLKGETGAPGTPVNIRGVLGNVSMLPAAAPNGDGYQIAGRLHLRVLGAWMDMGPFLGPQGLKGEPGTKGDQGDTGAQGTTGDIGAPGAAFRPMGTKLTLAEVYALTDQQPGDTWIVQDIAYSWRGDTWINMGAFRGPEGLKGDQGLQGIRGQQGSQGPQGVAGPQGIKGEQGAGVKVLGRLADTNALPGSGITGEGYIIGTNFWVWTGIYYADVGPIQGPKGDQGSRGLQGEQGLQGDLGFKGDRGDAGSRWLSFGRTPTSVDGLVGDYFLDSLTSRYYYKSANLGWTLAGTLGGSAFEDVDHDDLAYVRKNGEWVEQEDFIVDAPEDDGIYFRQNGDWIKAPFLTEVPQDGKKYVRINHQWVELTFPAPPSLANYVTEAPDDTKPYARKSKGWVEVVTPDVSAFISDAPSDTKLYARKGAAWAEVVFPAAQDLSNLVVEAPTDGQQYARKSSGWAVVAVPDVSGFLSDALSDGKLYARKSAGWAEVVMPAVPDVSNLVAEAPNDTKLYGRKSKGWIEVVFPAAPDLSNLVAEAPNDANQYARKGHAWAPIQFPTPPDISGLIAEAPNDGKQYARKSAVWAEVAVPDITNLVPEALNDAKLYGRKSKGWVEVVVPDVTNLVAEAPNDTKLYGRKSKGWVEVVIPAAPDLSTYVTDAPNDTTQYVRKGRTWTAVAFPTAPDISNLVAEAPNDTKLYGRKSKGWVEVVIPAASTLPAAPSTTDNKSYTMVNGAWALEVAPKAVDLLAYKVSLVSSTLDLAVQQVFRVDSSTARTLVFANVPASTLAMTVVVKLSGNTGAVTWPTGIAWSSGTPPVLGGAFTVVVLLWDGTAWTGSVGSSA